jgi:hypothetical protein
MRVYNVQDYLAAEICFLCEVDIRGTIYRFSSFPIDLDTGDGFVFYGGNLEDPILAQSLTQVGDVKLSANSISLALVFPFNVAKRQINGIGIDNALVTLYFVTVKNGIVQQTYDERIPYFTGVINEPIYGHPDRDEGFVEFSVENEVIFADISLLRALNGDAMSFDGFSYSHESLTTQGVIDYLYTDGIIDRSVIREEGKIIPAIIGAPGITYQADGTSLTFPGSPVYQFAEYFSPSFPAYLFILLAGHAVKATTVDLQDNAGNYLASAPVYHSTGARGNVFAYTYYRYGDLAYATNKDSRQYEYYARWLDGGGAVSPYTGQELQYGGDLIVWVLNALQIDFDREAFESVRPVLNQYIFAGYINDPEIKAYEFLQKYIIPYLPVSLAAGARGIYPIIDHRNTDLFYNARASITAGDSFERVSAIEPQQAEIINDLIVKYGVGFSSNYKLDLSIGGGLSQSIGGSEYKGQVYIRAERLSGIESPYEIVSPYCIISQQRYGVQSQTLELDYVHDRNTAIKIGLDYIRRKSLPEKKIRYQAPFSLGYYNIGDVIILTDEDIGFVETTVQIVGKEYSGAFWYYDVMYQENPIDNERTI